MEENVIIPLPPKKNRIKGQKYLYKNEIKLWNGKSLHTICEHNKRKYDCIICKGSNVCIHKKIKPNCRICSPQTFCKHNKRKTRCIECNGKSICIHNKIRDQCILCGGVSICIHNRRKYYFHQSVTRHDMTDYFPSQTIRFAHHRFRARPTKASTWRKQGYCL